MEHIVSNIIGAITNSSAAGSLIKPGGSIIGSALENNNQLAELIDIYQEEDPNSTNLAPKAYLAILFFDERFQFDATSSYIEKVIYNPGHLEEIDWMSSNAREATKNGYAYIFFINESEENVYFDNFMLSHERGRILDETHYYPFGLTMAGISAEALGILNNNKGYNGNELQNTEFNDGYGLNIYDFNARTYDQQIGRFIQIDPMLEDGGQESLNPFHFAYNNPARFNDPDGKCPCAIPLILIGRAIVAGYIAYKGAEASQPLVDHIVNTLENSASTKKSKDNNQNNNPPKKSETDQQQEVVQPEKGKRSKEANDAGEQYEGISKAQDQAKKQRPSKSDQNSEWEGISKRPKQNKINSTEKSKQRDKKWINRINFFTF